jgi:hypothetical protein
MATDQIDWKNYTKTLNWFNLRLDQFLKSNGYYPNSIMLSEDIWNAVKNNKLIVSQHNTFFGLNVVLGGNIRMFHDSNKVEHI